MKFGSVVYEIGLYAIGQTKRQTNKQTDGQTDTCADPRGEPGDSLFWKGKRFFTARRYASAVYAVVVCLSVCLSVSPSVTSWHCTKTSKHRITQTTPYDSPGTLVFLTPKIRGEIPTGSPRSGVPNRGG